MPHDVIHGVIKGGHRCVTVSQCHTMDTKSSYTDTPGPEFPVPGGYPTHQNSIV
jgi:hypothetical protein